MGGFADTAVWGLIWAMFAVVAGAGLAAAAATLSRNREPDYDAGYNALAPTIDRASA